MQETILSGINQLRCLTTEEGEKNTSSEKLPTEGPKPKVPNSKD